MDWGEFFETKNSIYVSARHRMLHDQWIAKFLIDHIPGDDAHVLDFGCGQASAADFVAQNCAMLYLFDASRQVRSDLSLRFAHKPNICVLDTAALENMPPESLDAVFVVSVTQYAGEAEFLRWLENFYSRLKPNGLLVVADVAPRTASAWNDAFELLKFGWRGGFFFAACFGLLRTCFSNYRDLRVKIGLTAYDEAEMLDILRQHDFEAYRAKENVGHNQKRMTFLAYKR